jgi:hypothetical protein
MKCDKIMALLDGYLDGELSATDSETVKNHLGECPACAGELAELRRVAELVGRLPVMPAPAALMERLRQNLERAPGQALYTARPFYRYRWLAASLVSVAALILVVFTVMIQLRQPALSPDRTGPAPETAAADGARQISISALDVGDAVEKIYRLAALNFGDAVVEKAGARAEKTEDSLILSNKANSPEPTRMQILKVTLPLSRRDEFIRQVRAGVSDKTALSKVLEESSADLEKGRMADKGPSGAIGGYAGAPPEKDKDAEGMSGGLVKSRGAREALKAERETAVSAPAAPGSPGSPAGGALPERSFHLEPVRPSGAESEMLHESVIRQALANPEILVEITIIVEPEIK